MAKPIKKRNAKAAKKKAGSPFNIYWSKNNYLLLLLGFALLIIGYYFMSMGKWNSFPSLVISPIILIIGYVIVLPIAILYRKKNVKEDSQDKEVAPGKS